VKGRFDLISPSTPSASSSRCRKGDKLYPVSWEEARKCGRKLKAVYDASARIPLASSVSNRTSNEENYLLQRWRARLWHQQHRSSSHRDYTGLITALGSAPAIPATMEQFVSIEGRLLVGNDPTNQNPLVGWQIRSGIAITAHSSSSSIRNDIS